MQENLNKKAEKEILDKFEDYYKKKKQSFFISQAEMILNGGLLEK